MSTTDPYGSDPEVAKVTAQDAEWRRRTMPDEDDWPTGDRKAEAAYHPGEHALFPVMSAEDAERLRQQWASVARPSWGEQPVVVNVQAPTVQPYVEPPSRIVHGLLTVATGFLWAPVWIVAERRYRRRVRNAREQASRG